MKDSSPCLNTRLGRRAFLTGSAAAVTGIWLPLEAGAQPASIRELRGEVLVNGKAADRSTGVRPGDTVVTGPNGYVVFVVGQDAFMLRDKSELRLEGSSASGALINGLRLLTGALGAVFGRRQTGKVNIVAATVTAGIRGTGVYLQSMPEGTYFCSCFGTVDLQANANASDRESIEATRHNNPRMILNQPRNGELFVPSTFQTHTDAEMEMLEAHAGRRAPWVK